MMTVILDGFVAVNIWIVVFQVMTGPQAMKISFRNNHTRIIFCNILYEVDTTKFLLKVNAVSFVYCFISRSNIIGCAI
jgi:hypothetical protein